MRYTENTEIYILGFKMHTYYKHTQIGYYLIFIMGIAILICGSLSFVFDQHQHSGAQFGGWLCGIVTLILLICLLLFYQLTVEITDTRLRFRFGLGLIRKTIPLDQIVSAVPVRNSWLAGWGIHHVGSGWLYNVSGMDAVEIELESGKKLRIGTDEPKQLTEAILQAIATNG